jgi:hypothetical protein
VVNEFNTEWTHEDKRTGAQYSMTVDQVTGKVTLVFKGSDSLVRNGKLYMDGIKDWLANLACWSAPYKNMKGKWYVCHRFYGIFRKWKAIRDKVRAFIGKHYFPGMRIKVMGFSQGAGIAVFCAEDLTYMMFHEGLKFSIVTYAAGCPKLFSPFGFKHVMNRLNAMLLINGNDAVTKLPWWNTIAGPCLHKGYSRARWYRYSVKDHSLEEYQKLYDEVYIHGRTTHKMPIDTRYCYK